MTALLRIFPSYGHDASEELVGRIKANLEKRGHDVWFDMSKIRFSSAWKMTMPACPKLIPEEIKARERVILCESEHFRNSNWVRQEVELIKGMEGKVFEVVYLSKEPPSRTSQGCPSLEARHRLPLLRLGRPCDRRRHSPATAVA